MIVVLFTDARDKGQYREREREKRQSGMARRQTVGERQVDALNAVAGQQQRITPLRRVWRPGSCAEQWSRSRKAHSSSAWLSYSLLAVARQCFGLCMLIEAYMALRGLVEPRFYAFMLALQCAGLRDGVAGRCLQPAPTVKSCQLSSPLLLTGTTLWEER